MIGERENINSNTDYGALVMRPYDIAGNEISAFYDNADNLVFVLDNTVSNKKTNVLLVINPEAGKRWDEILSGKYGVDLETIRPKVDNKYQKLDIEYSGLYVYDNLIRAYNAGDDLGDSLEQLEILRDSAVRNSAMVRLTTANDTISKTNITITKTKESIVKLQNRVKILRAKLSEAKKEIGRVATKQSASKILKLESQIDAANEKIKRSKKRLESAQKRLEMATVDAELATELLNQPTVVKSKTISAPLTTIKEPEIQTMPEMLGGDDYEEDESDRDDYVEESADTSVDDVKPLFDTDPQILNEDIAFKPIEFAAPAFSDITMKEHAPEAPALDTQQENQSVLESMRPVTEQENSITQENDLMFQPVGVPEISEEKSALEVLPSVAEQNVQTVPEDIFLPQPVVEPEFVDKMSDFETLNPVNNQNIETSEDVVATPESVAPTVQYKNELDYAKAKEHTKNGPLYYVLLFVLIILSVFTLWLYQKHMATDSTPVLTAKTAESSVVSQSAMDEEENVVTTSTVEEPIDDEKQFKNVIEYRNSLRAFQRPQTGNIFARALKSLKAANTGAKTLNSAAKVARAGMSSRSAKLGYQLFDATLKHGARLARFERDVGLLYGAVAFLGDMYDKTSTTSQEFSNGIEFKPLGLLSADDLEGQENVVNYGMWLMWVGNSTDPADDDAAYLQAMDFASKFYYELDNFQDEHNANCNVDIYVVHPFIKLDETNTANPKGEMYYLFMNEIPWTTNIQFNEQVPDIEDWERVQADLGSNDPEKKYHSHDNKNTDDATDTISVQE